MPNYQLCTYHGPFWCQLTLAGYLTVKVNREGVATMKFDPSTSS